MLYSFYDSPEGGVSRGESERHLAATRCRFAPIERLPRPSEVGILSESRERPFPFLVASNGNRGEAGNAHLLSGA